MEQNLLKYVCKKTPNSRYQFLFPVFFRSVFTLSIDIEWSTYGYHDSNLLFSLMFSSVSFADKQRSKHFTTFAKVFLLRTLFFAFIFFELLFSSFVSSRISSIKHKLELVVVFYEFFDIIVLTLFKPAKSTRRQCLFGFVLFHFTL